MQDQKQSSLIKHKLFGIEADLENLHYKLAELQLINQSKFTKVNEIENIQEQKIIHELTNISQKLKQEITECKHLETNLLEQCKLLQNIVDTNPNWAFIKDSEEKFRATFEQAAVGIAHVNIDGKWIRINQKFCDIIGYSREELLELNFQDITYKEDLQLDLEYVRQILADKIQTYSMEKRYIHKDGHLVWINLTVSLVRELNGEPKYFISVIEDITERKRVQKERDRFFNNSLDLMAITDHQGNIQLINSAWEITLGYTKSELEGKNFQDFIHLEDLPTSQTVFAQEININQPIVGFENRFRCANGTYKWLSWNAIPIPEEGISYRFAREITPAKAAEASLKQAKAELELQVQEHTSELKQSIAQLQQEINQHQYTEAALRESEEKFRQVVENMEQVFYMTNPNMSYVEYISPAYQKTWGRTCQSLYERPYSWVEAIFIEDREKLKQKRRQQINGETVDIEYRILHTDGSVRWIWDRGFVVKNEEGEVCKLVGVASDITDRKQAEAALQQAKDRLQAVLYAVPGFVAWFDADLRYQGVNGHLAATFNLDPEDFAGKELGFQNNSNDFSKFMHEFMISSQSTATQILDTKINGNIRNYLTVIQKYQQGKAAVSVGIDITEREEAEAQIKASLQEKEVLIKEIHHRVKNNLQIVSSLLKLQSKYIKDEAAMKLFNESYNRIRSMALVHEQLYQSQNLVQINVSEYIPDLVSNLFRSYNIYSSRISHKMEIDNIYLDIDTAIPCGLIINELISNCLKYAFENYINGEILVKYQLIDNNYLIEINDNGVGLPENFSIENNKSLGLKLVDNLTKQLNGILEIKSQKNDGTSFKIIFPVTN